MKKEISKYYILDDCYLPVPITTLDELHKWKLSNPDKLTLKTTEIGGFSVVTSFVGTDNKMVYGGYRRMPNLWETTVYRLRDKQRLPTGSWPSRKLAEVGHESVCNAILKQIEKQSSSVTQ
jgi:hypothetical protein